MLFSVTISQFLTALKCTLHLPQEWRGGRYFKISTTSDQATFRTSNSTGRLGPFHDLQESSGHWLPSRRYSDSSSSCFCTETDLALYYPVRSIHVRKLNMPSRFSLSEKASSIQSYIEDETSIRVSVIAHEGSFAPT